MEFTKGQLLIWNRGCKKAGLGIMLLLFLFPQLGISESTSERRQVSDQTNANAQGAAIRTLNDPSWDATGDRWGPFFEEMGRLSRQMDRIFNQSLNRFTSGQSAGAGLFEPQIDIEEKGDRFIAKADLPGMQKDQIKVEVTDNVLNLSGERKVQQEVEKEGYYRVERNFGAFQRSIPLPEEVMVDQVTAKYENGVLEITLPKAKPSKESKMKSVTIA